MIALTHHHPPPVSEAWSGGTDDRVDGQDAPRYPARGHMGGKLFSNGSRIAEVQF